MDFLTRVLRARLTTGFRVGLIAAAATTGALAAFGARQGAPGSAFAELVSSAGGSAPPRVALVGIVAHAAAVMGIAILFTIVAAGLRGVRLLAASATVACLAFVLNTAILPVATGDTGTRVLDSAHLAALYLLLAVALVVGMRLALREGDLG